MMRISDVPLAAALLALFTFAPDVEAYTPPEFFGGYAVVDDTLLELVPVKVSLKSYTANKNTVAAFTGLPTKLPIVSTFTPSLILYDQDVGVGGINVARLAPVPLGRSEADGFAWMVTESVPLKVKPLDQAGMFYFAPTEPLSSGYYALYGGQQLGSGVTAGSVFAFEVKHPKQDAMYDLLARFMDAVKLHDWKTVADLSVTTAGSGGNATLVPVSEELASSFKKPFFYTAGGSVGAGGIRNGSDTPTAGSQAYYCVDINIYGALATITVNGETITGDSPRQMIVSEIEPGVFKVYTLDKHWIYTGCS